MTSTGKSEALFGRKYLLGLSLPFGIVHLLFPMNETIRFSQIGRGSANMVPLFRTATRTTISPAMHLNTYRAAINVILIGIRSFFILMKLGTPTRMAVHGRDNTRT